MVARSVIGTNTCGLVPSVVPSNPRGATPTIVRVWPLTIMPLFSTFGSAANLVVQYAWLRTTTGASPTRRSSLESKSRPSVGCTCST